MHQSNFSFKAFFISLFIAIIVVTAVFAKDWFRQTTTVVFCDVGQGDGAYIRTEDKVDILVDAGPNRKILNCLGKYMPFYDRTIELAFLSHPQKDHAGGYLYILDRYKIINFISTPVQSQAQFFRDLQEKLTEKKINVRYLYAGENIGFGKTQINFFWPDKGFLGFSDNQDPNDFSQVFILTHKNTKILFTGDAENPILDLLTKRFSGQSALKTDLLKAPHHGSKNGLTREFLQLADPTISVISVGKNNSYGHPSKSVLDMFRALNKKHLRTDENGNIVFEINKNGWVLKNLKLKMKS